MPSNPMRGNVIMTCAMTVGGSGLLSFSIQSAVCWKGSAQTRVTIPNLRSRTCNDPIRTHGLPGRRWRVVTCTQTSRPNVGNYVIQAHALVLSLKFPHLPPFLTLPFLTHPARTKNDPEALLAHTCALAFHVRTRLQDCRSRFDGSPHRQMARIQKRRALGLVPANSREETRRERRQEGSSAPMEQGIFRTGEHLL